MVPFELDAVVSAKLKKGMKTDAAISAAAVTFLIAVLLDDVRVDFMCICG